MNIEIGCKTKLAIRSSLYLLIAACTQSALESYGCACESRTYSIDEIAGYRADAARGDVKALAEMQEYYMWRKGEHQLSSAEYKREERMEESFRQRRLIASDPGAIEGEVNRLVYEATFEDDLSDQQRRANLMKARGYAGRLRQPLTMRDYNDDARPTIMVLDYIERELSKPKRVQVRTETSE